VEPKNRTFGVFDEIDPHRCAVISHLHETFLWVPKTNQGVHLPDCSAAVLTLDQTKLVWIRNTDMQLQEQNLKESAFVPTLLDLAGRRVGTMPHDKSRIPSELWDKLKTTKPVRELRVLGSRRLQRKMHFSVALESTTDPSMDELVEFDLVR
jgi:hypothetical protein